MKKIIIETFENEKWRGLSYWTSRNIEETNDQYRLCDYLGFLWQSININIPEGKS
jgi:hypothetical protein